MIYQDPLAYLPGLEGIALLDARAEDHDRAFAGTRLAKIRRPLAGKKPRDRSEFWPLRCADLVSLARGALPGWGSGFRRGRFCSTAGE